MSFNIKKLAIATALGFMTILGTSEIANAQGNRNNDRRHDQKQQEKIRKQNAKIAQERARAEQQRRAEAARRNQRNQSQQPIDDRYRPNEDRRGPITKSGNDRSNGQGYYKGNANANTNRNNRYRVYRNGSYYNTDQRGADLLRQAVNAGYQQGFHAGRNDRNDRRRATYRNSNVYQSGTHGYQSYVNRSQYQYYFRQGFQRGYQDGSNMQYQNDYDGQYQYGFSNNGSRSILGTVLSQILNLQSY
jgi:hypothetical protein